MSIIENGLFWWERKTLLQAEISPTRLPVGYHGLTTLVFTVLLALWGYWHGLHTWQWAIIPLLARAVALDAHFRVLPHIYTWPVFLLGFFLNGIGAVIGVALLVAAAALWSLLWWLGTGRKPYLGGGDVWLCLALLTWVDLLTFGVTVLFSLLFMLPTERVVGRGVEGKHTPKKATEPAPYGPALILGLFLASGLGMRLGTADLSNWPLLNMLFGI